MYTKQFIYVLTLDVQLYTSSLQLFSSYSFS